MNTQNTPPPSPSAAAAAEALQLAEQSLEEALTLGGDTSEARAAVQVARDALAALVSSEQRAVEQAAAAERDAAAQEAADAVHAAEEEFVAVVSGTIDAPPDAEPLTTPAVPGVVLQAVQQVQRAQRALAAAQAPYAAAAKDVAAVRARLDAKEAALAEIRTRRARGDEQPGDAAELHALAMDSEDLRRIVGDLQARVDAVAPAVQAAQQAVHEAGRAVVAAKSRAELDAMTERLRAVERHFCMQVRTLRLEGQKRGFNNFGSLYTPSATLRAVSNGAWI